MSQNKAPNALTTCALNRSAATYDRREAIVSLLAVPIALTTSISSATEAAKYPLWNVATAGGHVYLLGHTPPRSMDWSDSRAESLLRTCSALWNETNQSDHANTQDLIQRYGIDANKPLQTWLSPTDRDRLSQAAKIAGVPEDAFEPFRPWLVGQALEGAFFSAQGISGRNADAVLVSESNDAGLSVSSEFATKEDAARWFSDFTPVQEVQYLRYILDEILSGHDEGQRIYADWAAGKDARAADWVARMRRLYPELYRSIVTTRNQGWIPRIQSMLAQSKSTMIVVGLYHLVGSDSIQALLRANGLHAKRM